MLGFLLGISICLNIILILLIFFYLKIKSKKTKLLNNLDQNFEKNWDNFFASGGFDEKN